MNRFLNVASKALAVIGVLTLMYAASEVQQAKAQPNPMDCRAVVVPNGPLQGWFTCNGTVCPTGAPPKCCQVPTWDEVGPKDNINSYNCCVGALIPCPQVAPGGG